jgi:hypothetical protein
VRVARPLSPESITADLVATDACLSSFALANRGAAAGGNQASRHARAAQAPPADPTATPRRCRGGRFVTEAVTSLIDGLGATQPGLYIRSHG